MKLVGDGKMLSFVTRRLGEEIRVIDVVLTRRTWEYSPNFSWSKINPVDAIHSKKLLEMSGLGNMSIWVGGTKRRLVWEDKAIASLQRIATG
jgi:hypothetical protein